MRSAVQEQHLFSVPRKLLSNRGWLLAGSAAAVFVAGCGNNYRPVVSAINPVGPSTQPTVYAVALSDPGGGLNGLVNVIDVFGDTVIATANVAPLPTYLATDASGESYVLHNNSALLDSFTAQAGLMTNAVHQSSLTQGSNPTQVNPGSSSNAMFITEPSLSRIAVLSGGSSAAAPTARQDLPVPANPVYTVGITASARYYTLSQGATPGTSLGTATAIENGTNNTISASIPVGINPVYGIMTADTRRTFVVNSGATGATSGTVSVINTTGNTLDTTLTVGPKPVWADIAPTINELAVVNQGNGTAKGSLSVVNISLCSAATVTGNAQCNPANPVDSVDFGKTLATVPVGVNPVQVAVLTDLNKAYVANAGDGTVTVVDLNTMVATKTITVGGTLNWIGAVAGSPTGKVLVTAKDTNTLTLIRTDNDTVTATVDLQGKGIAVRVAQ